MGAIKCENCENTTFWLQMPVSGCPVSRPSLWNRWHSIMWLLHLTFPKHYRAFLQLFSVVWLQQVCVSNQQFWHLSGCQVELVSTFQCEKVSSNRHTAANLSSCKRCKRDAKCDPAPRGLHCVTVKQYSHPLHTVTGQPWGVKNVTRDILSMWRVHDEWVSHFYLFFFIKLWS